MGDEHKDIKITPNTGESASPKIEVTGGNNATKTITINDDGTISFDSTIAATSGSVANGNANLVTGDAVFDYIALQGYTTNTGDITGVDLTGGTGVTIGSETGTTSGNYSATISIGQAVGTGDSVTFANVTVADDIIHSGDTNNLISFGTDTQSFETGGTARMNISDSGLQIGSGARVTTINTSFSDNNTSLMTSAAIDDRIQSFGYTTNTGDITGVDLTGGTGVTIGSETNTGSGAYSSTISIGQAVGTSDDVTFSTLTLASDLIHSGDTNNKISFGTDTQSFQTAGNARLTIGADGKIQIGPDTVNPSGITTGKVTISRDSTDETTDGPTLMLVDGDDDASPGPVIKLYRNTASPADNDVIGQLLFSGEDSAGGERTYGSISARTLDITSGTRDSEILLKSTKDGSDITTLTLHRGAVKFNDAYTFPTSDGSANQVLQTDGSGSLSFATISSGGASLANDANNRVVTATGSGGINGEANLTFDGSTLALAGKQTITVDDTVSEAFKVTITDTDSTDDSTPFVVDGDGRVGIGTASPVSGFALTLNGDGSAYEGIAFQVGGSTKFKISTDSTSVYYDSAINTGNQNFRVKDSGGNLRPALGIEGSGFRVAVGYNGTSGSSLNPKNTFQVNVGTENGIQDNDDGILLLNSDLSIADGDTIAGIGFATRDGNIPSVTTEAAAAIVAYAAVAHSTTAKGGDLAFLTSPVTQSDDTASLERMRISAGGSVGIGIDDPVSKLHVKGDTSVTSQTTSGAIGLTLEQDGAGDTALNFLLTGTQRWIMGIDNSDSDKFKIQTAETSLKSDADSANNAIKAMTITTAGNVGFGTNDPQSSLHVSSGTSGDAVLILEADTDNNDEADQPFIVFEQDGGVQHSAIGSFSGGNTDNNALILSNSVDNSGVQAGMIFKTGTSAGYANATESMRIYPAGETQARKTKVKAVSSNTTLGDDDSGKTIYWTGGTLTLPATAESGQQFVIINNTNGSATPSLGTSNSIATNWTAHAAMADETARTYIAVAANTWIYIG